MFTWLVTQAQSLSRLSVKSSVKKTRCWLRWFNSFSFSFFSLALRLTHSLSLYLNLREVFQVRASVLCCRWSRLVGTEILCWINFCCKRERECSFWFFFSVEWNSTSKVIWAICCVLGPALSFLSGLSFFSMLCCVFRNATAWLEKLRLNGSVWLCRGFFFGEERMLK